MSSVPGTHKMSVFYVTHNSGFSLNNLKDVLTLYIRVRTFHSFNISSFHSSKDSLQHWVIDQVKQEPMMNVLSLPSFLGKGVCVCVCVCARARARVCVCARIWMSGKGTELMWWYYHESGSLLRLLSHEIEVLSQNYKQGHHGTALNPTQDSY